MSARNISDDAESNDGRVIVWALQDVKESLDALVEQQRLANLIALAGQRIEYDETTALFTDLGIALKMRQQAFDGLGL